MSLEHLESLQSWIKNCIVLFSAFAGIIGAFYNQKMVDLEIKQKRDKLPMSEWRQRTKLWFIMHTKEWGAFIISTIVVIVLTLIQNTIDGKVRIAVQKNQDKIDKEKQDRQDKRDADLQSSYFSQIRILKEDSKIERQETQKQNKDDLKDITGNMSKMFGEGQKKSDKNAEDIKHNIDTNSNKLAGKIDKIDTNSKGMPAYIALIAEPHNVFNVELRNDTIIGMCVFENSGDYVAYSVKTDLNIVFKINNVFYKIPAIIGPPQDLNSHVTRHIGFALPMTSKTYNSIDEIYCIVTGKYFLDDMLKNEKKIKLATKINPKTNEHNGFSGRKSIDELLNSAILVVDETQLY